MLSLLVTGEIVVAFWNLFIRILFDLVLSGPRDPTDGQSFQRAFGAIFTVILALEFERSIVVSLEKLDTVSACVSWFWSRICASTSFVIFRRPTL